MKIKYLHCFFLVITLLSLSSCGEYNKILKSPDPEVKLEYAKKYFDEGKYGRATTLLEDIQTAYTASSKEQEVLFLLAQSYFLSKDYESAALRFLRYYRKFPKGEYSELALFNNAYALYLLDPDLRLDQSSTIRSIEAFQNFLEAFPQSEKSPEVENYMLKMQEKLAEKELRAAQLYYKLGYYMGNNYEACVITSKEALKNYNFDPYGEEFQFLIVKSKLDEAEISYDEKKATRYRNVIDEYFNYANMYPNGKYLKECTKYYNKALKALNQTEEDLKIDTTIGETKN